MKDYIKHNEYDNKNMFGKNVRYLLAGWKDIDIKRTFYPTATASSSYVAEHVKSDRRAFITTVMRFAEIFDLTLDELVYVDLEERNKIRDRAKKIGR